MMKLQEIRQKQHELDIKESKLQIISVAKTASEMPSGLLAPDRTEEEIKENLLEMQDMERTIKKVRANLSVEESNVRNSIETEE